MAMGASATTNKDWLHNLQRPEQREYVGPLVQKLFRTSRIKNVKIIKNDLKSSDQLSATAQVTNHAASPNYKPTAWELQSDKQTVIAMSAWLQAQGWEAHLWNLALWEP